VRASDDVPPPPAAGASFTTSRQKFARPTDAICSCQRYFTQSCSLIVVTADLAHHIDCGKGKLSLSKLSDNQGADNYFLSARKVYGCCGRAAGRVLSHRNDVVSSHACGGLGGLTCRWHDFTSEFIINESYCVSIQYTGETEVSLHPSFVCRRPLSGGDL